MQLEAREEKEPVQLDNYVSALHAMKALSMPKSTFYKSLKHGDIPHSHFGTALRVNLTLLREKMATPGAQPVHCDRCHDNKSPVLEIKRGSSS